MNSFLVFTSLNILFLKLPNHKNTNLWPTQRVLTIQVFEENSEMHNLCKTNCSIKAHMYRINTCKLMTMYKPCTNLYSCLNFPKIQSFQRSFDGWLALLIKYYPIGTIVVSEHVCVLQSDVMQGFRSQIVTIDLGSSSISCCGINPVLSICCDSRARGEILTRFGYLKTIGEKGRF